MAILQKLSTFDFEVTLEYDELAALVIAIVVRSSSQQDRSCLVRLRQPSSGASVEVAIPPRTAGATRRTLDPANPAERFEVNSNPLWRGLQKEVTDGVKTRAEADELALSRDWAETKGLMDWDFVLMTERG